jgi:hypothetical protein
MPKSQIVQNFDEHLVGIWPIKFTANPDDTAGERQADLDYKAHGDRSSVHQEFIGRLPLGNYLLKALAKLDSIISRWS